jgi:hypothetical protein
MIDAARRAEYDYYQRGRLLGSERFIPTVCRRTLCHAETVDGHPPLPLPDVCPVTLDEMLGDDLQP